MFSFKSSKSELQGVSIYISTLSLTATAVDRSRSVAVTRRRQQDRLNMVTTGTVILTINVTATLAILPYTAHIHWQVRPYTYVRMNLRYELRCTYEFTL